MKKIEYRYSNGTFCEHTIYIKPKTIKKECENAMENNIFYKKRQDQKKVCCQTGRCLFTENSISIFQNNKEYKFKIERKLKWKNI